MGIRRKSNATGKTFMTLSKEECLIAYKDVLSNSESKWEAGLKNAKNGEHGIALSLAIISIEELVKSLIILMDGKGFNIRSTKGIHTIFRNHQIRFVIAYAMFVVSVFGEELIRLIQMLKGDPKLLPNLIVKFTNNDPVMLRWLKIYSIKKFLMLKREFEWFSQVDLFRQDGFYSDYDGMLRSPLKIDGQNYFEVIHRLDKVRRVGKSLIDSLNSEEELYTEHFQNMKQMFYQENFYDKIGAALSTVRKARQNPFDVIVEKIKG